MSGIFSPKSAQARPLNGSVLPNYTPIRGLHGAHRAQNNRMGEYFTNGAVSGLGRALGIASIIPGDCWDAPGFSDCHATQFAKAQADCQGGEAAANFGGDMDTCTDVYADQYSMQICAPNSCPQTIPKVQTGGMTAAQVTAAQQAINAALTKNGYKTIAVDGKLGPGTCGAGNYMMQTFGDGTYVAYNMAAYCSAWTNPTKVGATVPDQTVVLQESNGITTPTVPQWGQSAPTLANTQAQINTSLVAAGYNPIPVTGVLDAQTCGAMQWMKQNMGQDLMTETGQNCQAFVMPTKKAVSAPGSKPPPGAPATPGAPPSTHPVTTAGLMMGGLALLVAGGAYYYAKKKGMV